MDNTIKPSKGFITVATGKYYCRLAQNMIMSYRLFSDNKYPFYVITDKKGEKRLKKYFDGVIVTDQPYYTFMDKMTVYQNSPFGETIFIDADTNFIRDITYLFEEFEKNDSPVSCIGSVRSISEWGKPIHYGYKAVERFSLESYIAFGGGVYYYKRCSQTDEFFGFIFDELVPHYNDYELKLFRVDQMADEPLIGLAIVVKGMKPLDSELDIIKYDDHMMDSLRWNIRDRRCTFLWKENRLVAPSIVHYGTHNTRHKKYVYYNAIVRCRYHHIRPLAPFVIAYDETVLLFRHLSRKNDRKAFAGWFKAHFTKEYWIRQKDRIKSIIKK